MHPLQPDIDALRRQLYSILQRLHSHATEQLPEQSFACLRCRAGEQMLALDLGPVQEVVPLAELATAPEAPLWLAGILHLRGAAVPVIDVDTRLSGRSRLADLSDLIVICRLNEGLVGLLVADVQGLMTLDPGSLQRQLDGLPVAPFLLGMVHDENGLVWLLSPTALVAHADLPAATPPALETP